MANTTQGLPGLTFEAAIAPNPGLANRLPDLRETGDPRFGRYENEPNLRFRKAMRDIDEEEELLSKMLEWRPSRNERMQSQHLGFLSSDLSEDIGFEAAGAGFGESRFDRRLTSPAQLEDIEDARARQQSTLGVLGNSVAKMGVLAATTAADSWIGLPAGLINLVSESFSGNINSGREALNALVANPVSAYLQSINEKSEEIFKNYQTAEERNRPWWENMFTANFIGDTLIKNAGFTIGAVVGGKAAVGVLGRMTGANEARDAFKGLAAELGLAGKNPTEVVELLAKGSTSLEKQAAVKALAESASKLRRAELGLQIAGGLLAGTGEARIEALNGVSEFEKSLQDIYGDLDMERAKALRRVQDVMREKGLDINTPEGRAYYEEQKAFVDENFLDLQEQIAHDKAMVANTIFALNVPLLTAGDVAQWGKLMLGGYAIDRNLVKGIKKVSERAAVKGALQTPEELLGATRYAVRGNKFTRALGKVGAASRNVFIEAQEEMNQSLFSATAKAKAMGDTTEFLERLYDPMAVSDTVSWLDAAKEGMRQSWLNKDDWVEGFAGGFMGFMGLPSVSVKVNEKTGKQSPRLTMEGGIWSPLREQKDLYERRNKLVESLNNRLSSPDFLNYYYGKIGNRHFDSIKEDAVRQGNENLYKKADHAQLINDAMMFEKAGRLQDFLDIVDSFGNASDETIEQIKDLFPADDEVHKMTTSGMRTLINDNVERMKRQLDEYMKIAEDIRVVYGNTISDAQAAELTWQTAHLDEIEHDLKEILAHPETSSMLAAYRAENEEKTKDLTDYEVVSSAMYSQWLADKYKNKKDTVDKETLKTAFRDAQDAAYDMRERGSYIDHISALSQDPELVQKRMTRIKRQQEELRRLGKMVKAAKIMSTTDKLSEFIGAMEDLGDTVPDETLADIKKEAEKGNVVAKEYLIVRNIDGALEKHLRELARKTGASEAEIKQALAAWNYFKHNADSAFDLTSKHKPEDIASSIAGEKAVKLLDEAVESVMKAQKVYGKLTKRTVEKKKTGTGSEAKTEGTTKFKLTGHKLTDKKYKEIVADLQATMSEMTAGVMGGPNLLRVDLDKADIYFDGMPADGIIFLYYPHGKMSDKGKPVIPVAYDSGGNEIDSSDVAKLTNSEGLSMTEWFDKADFPVGGFRVIPLATDNMARKMRERLPIDRKGPKPVSPDSKKKEDKDSGKRTKPHKFIAPNMDMALLGSDGQAVAEVLKSLPEDSELRFGMEDEDGPVYILAGDSDIKIGILPEESEGSDIYSGLAELKQLIKDEFNESKDRRNANGLWVSEKYRNHLREKMDSGFVTIGDNIPLDEIPGFSGIKNPILMLVTDDPKGQRFLFSDDSVSIDDVQFRQGASNNVKAGFAYLLVPSGKKYIPVMLYTQNVNSETLDLHDPAVIATGFGKRVSDTIDKVVDALTTEKEKERVRKFKLWALNTANESDPNSLQRLLHFRAKGKVNVQFFIKETGKSHEGWFTNDDVVMVINRHYEDSNEDDPIMISKGKMKNGEEYSIRDQIIDALDQLEFETESGEVHRGPIVQIGAVHFEQDAKHLQERVREFIGSKMLLTDVKDFDLSMPSFIMDYWSVAQKKFLRPAHSEDTGKSVFKVTTKKVRGKASEKVASFEMGGKDIQYNLSSNQVKIGSGKWFNPMTSTKTDDEAVKKLGYKDVKTFFRTARALAVVADRYGDNSTGEGRIGDRVLLKDFTAGKDEGFILTGDGGKFMTASELEKFKNELKKGKEKKKEKKKDEEKKRVSRARKQIEEGDESEFRQEVGSQSRVEREQIARMETIRNVGQAIEHLRKHAPQYSEFLDYISGIDFYDEVLVQLADNVGSSSKGGDVYGTNRFKFNEKGSTFTNSIVVGKQSFGYRTLMHELVHAFTVVALRYDRNLYEDIKTQMNYLQDSIGKARLSRELGSYEAAYAFENPYEFIAEFFSNPRLQKLAKEVKAPEEVESKSQNIFVRIVNYIADKLRSLFKNKGGSYYENLKEKLYSVIDRQLELQETGKMIFKTPEEFKKAQRLAKGSTVNGVASSTVIPTVEQEFHYRMAPMPFDDEVLVPSPGLFKGPGKFLTLSQLFDVSDEYSSLAGARHFATSKNLYEYNSGGKSSLYGVRDEASGAFVVVRAHPAGESDYSALVRTVAESSSPMVIGSAPEDVFYYTALGLHPVHGSEVNGKIFMANDAFTSSHLYSLGTTYRPFADVLDSNDDFVAFRRGRYSDQEWDKFSEMEKFHARKCLGI